MWWRLRRGREDPSERPPASSPLPDVQPDGALRLDFLEPVRSAAQKVTRRQWRTSAPPSPTGPAWPKRSTGPNAPGAPATSRRVQPRHLLQPGRRHPPGRSGVDRGRSTRRPGRDDVWPGWHSSAATGPPQTGGCPSYSGRTSPTRSPRSASHRYQGSGARRMPAGHRRRDHRGHGRRPGHRRVPADHHPARPAPLPPLEIVKLYHLRWEIETAYLELNSTILGETLLQQHVVQGRGGGDEYLRRGLSLRRQRHPHPRQRGPLATGGMPVGRGRQVTEVACVVPRGVAEPRTAAFR